MLNIKRALLVGLGAMTLFTGLALPKQTLAATGSNPSPYWTGTVECSYDTATGQTQLTMKPPTMQAYNFTGTFRTWQVVKYSFDGVNWNRWFRTAAQDFAITAPGGSSWFRGHSYPINAVGQRWFVMVYDVFQWFDASGQLITTKVLRRDSYLQMVNWNYIGSETTAGACVMR